MPVYLPQIAQPEHCKLWLQPGLSLVGLDHGANLPYNPELYDLSGNNNHCTMYNQAHNEASGYRYDAASGLWVLACDGVDDYGMLAVPNLVKTASKTLQVWAKLTADIRDSYSMVMSLADAQFYIGFRGPVGDTKNCPMFSYRDAAESQKYSAAEVEAIVGEMHLYTWTCDVSGSNVTITMYIDSTQIYTLTRVTGISATYNPAAYMFTHTSKVYRFGGNIASVLFYDTALSASEVAANYALGAGIPAARKPIFYFPGQPTRTVSPGIVVDGACQLLLHGERAYGSGRGCNSPFLPLVKDLSGNGNDGTMTGFAGTTASGFDGADLVFDGVDDYIRIADKAGLRAQRPMSVVAWVKLHTIGDILRVFNKRLYGGWALLVQADGAINFTFYQIANKVFSDVKILDTNWHMIVVTIGVNGEMHCYIDNNVPMVSTAMDAPWGNDSGPLDIALSKNTDGSIAGYSRGVAKYLAVYSRELSSLEVSQLYQNSFNWDTDYDLQPRPNVVLDSRVLLDLHMSRADGENPITNSPASRRIADLSGKNADCIILNTAGTAASGANGDGTWGNPHCLSFDGVDDYIQTNADSDSAGVHFYEWWMRSDRKSRNTIFSHGDARPWQGVFEIDYYYILPRLYLGTSNWRYWEKTPAQSDGQWHYWQLYYAGSGQDDITKAALWIDGVLQNVNNTMSSGPQQDAGLALCVGKGYSGYFAGDIASFRILNYLPTKAERLQTYQQGPYWPHWEERTVISHCLPITTAVDRAGAGVRTATAHIEPVATSVDRVGRGVRSVTAVAGPIVSSVDRVGRGIRTVTASIKPIATSVSRIGRGVRTVTAYCGRVVSSVTLGAPPIRMLWEAAISLQARYTATLHKSAAYTAIINKIAALTAVLRGVKRR